MVRATDGDARRRAEISRRDALQVYRREISRRGGVGDIFRRALQACIDVA